MRKILIALFFIIAIVWFFKVNSLNYLKHIEIRDNFVKHPEKLPTNTFAKNTSFWFNNLRADIYWIETIQYIGSNAVSSKYKKYLYAITDLITDLNPYFEHPYKIGLLLLPDYNPRYEDVTEEQQLEYVKQAEKLWLKWIKNFCDLEKVKLIENEYDLTKLWSEEKYQDSCKSFDIPYFLWFVYYFHLHNPLEAAKYYKIASAQKDALEWAKVMAAVMQWKGWDREKAYFMFLNMGKTLDSSEDKVCSIYAGELEKLWAAIFLNKAPLTADILKWVAKSRDEILWEFSDDREKELFSDSECKNYIHKATRELNLYYVELANEKYKQDNDWASAKDAKELFDKWYMDYLPIDFQQYEDYGIIYKYNRDTGNFDYDMGSYE